MTTDEIRNARNSFAGQLNAMIRDFEDQTGVKVYSINVERAYGKLRDPDTHEIKPFSVFKGVFVGLDASIGL